MFMGALSAAGRDGQGGVRVRRPPQGLRGPLGLSSLPVTTPSSELRQLVILVVQVFGNTLLHIYCRTVQEGDRREGEQDAFSGWVRLYCCELMSLGLGLMAPLVALFSPVVGLPFAERMVRIIATGQSILFGAGFSIWAWDNLTAQEIWVGTAGLVLVFVAAYVFS